MGELERKLQSFAEKPTSEQVYTIGGKQYCVVSHYIGEKDLDATLLDLAKDTIYATLRKKSSA